MWNTVFDMDEIGKLSNGIFAFRISTNSTDYSVHYNKIQKPKLELKNHDKDTRPYNRAVGAGIYYFLFLNWKKKKNFNIISFFCCRSWKTIYLGFGSVRCPYIGMDEYSKQKNKNLFAQIEQIQVPYRALL